MALARSRTQQRQIDYWPGFVDALSTLLLVFIFLLSVFMLAQFFSSRDASKKDDALKNLNAQIAQLTEILSLQKLNMQGMENNLSVMSATLEAEKKKNEGMAAALSSAGTASELEKQLGNERNLAARAAAQIEILNQQIAALRRQLSALEEALSASEGKDKQSQAQLADMGARLNLALAQKVQELSKFRSEFFGRLRQILGNRADMRLVGDRFVFQSEIFFNSGKAEINEGGKSELNKLANALKDLEREIPPELAWVARIDGHTDKRPIQASPLFASNWELSAARSIAVVKYLVSKGVSPQRLMAAGFGEFQPLDFGDGDEALKRNRRLELKLTER